MVRAQILLTADQVTEEQNLLIAFAASKRSLGVQDLMAP
jgi:hypothetical protein